MSEVEIEHLTKRFGDTVAVDDVSFTIHDDELLALLGPSGCGKTTTLRMIAGLEYPTEGRILIDDEDVTGVDPKNRDIAMVFQDLALYPHKTVRDNMGFTLSMRGYDKSDIVNRVERAAEILEIPDLLDRYPSELSGGQQQRVALGRAIVRDPEVFLMDEPLSSLDAKLRDQMRSEILELHQELDVTMVYVTHDQEIAMTLGDRIAVMDNGQIQQIATPSEIYKRPANEFVARFIGSPSINLFDGVVRSDNDEIWIEADDFKLTLADGLEADWRELVDAEVRLGLRPNDIYHPEYTPRSYTPGETVKVDVALVEELGPYEDAHIRVGGTELVARVTSDSGLRPGDTTDVIFDTTKLHVFDAESGDRVAITQPSPSAEQPSK